MSFSQNGFRQNVMDPVLILDIFQNLPPPESTFKNHHLLKNLKYLHRLEKYLNVDGYL